MRKHASRVAGLARLLPGTLRDLSVALPRAVRAAPATVTAVARQDPLRSGLAAGALLVAVFVLMASVWVIFGRGGDTNRTIMVEPPAPALVVPAGEIGPETGAPSTLPTAPSAGPSTTATPTSGNPTAGGSPKTPGGRSGTPAAGVPTAVRTSRPAERTPTPRPSPTATRTTTAPSGLTAQYGTWSSWETGFVGGVQLTNTGQSAQSWRVVLTFDDRAGVRITNVWNAQLSRDGGSNVLTGGPLAPGATATVGFEATKRTSRRTQPTSCTVNGRSCVVTAR